MLSWFQRRRAEAPGVLTGVPAVRRAKAYSAESGYVYQYHYEGYRAVESPEAGVQFVFSVTWDRKTFVPVRVCVGQRVASAWERGCGRELLHKERYAIAKMGLFRVFDGCEAPPLPDETWLTMEQVSEISRTLQLADEGESAVE